MSSYYVSMSIPNSNAEQREADTSQCEKETVVEREN